MRRLFLVLALFLVTTPVVAHELTPTYPKLTPSYMDGLLIARMSMFNAREDVEYYEVGVFDLAWNPIPFATTSKLLQVPYASTKKFDIYIRKQDEKRAVYVCTVSKLRSDEPSYAIISSKVCSRLDGGRP